MKATRSLLRGLKALEVLARSPDPIGPARLAGRIGLDRATAGRLLFTLGEAGFAQPLANGTYRLSTKLLELANTAPLGPRLRDLARPHLLDLRDATGETVHLGILEADHVVYIDKIDGLHPVRLVSAVGLPMPLHTTALGKAALAWSTDETREALMARVQLTPRTHRSITTVDELRRELEATRRRGFAIDDRENEEDACCVGAPILGAGGEVLAMVSLSGPSFRIGEHVAELGRGCRQTALRVSKAALAAAGPSP